MVRDTSFKNICFHETRFQFVNKISMQLKFLEFLKEVESIFKGESVKIQKLTQIWITCSHIEIYHKNGFFHFA